MARPDDANAGPFPARAGRAASAAVLARSRLRAAVLGRERCREGGAARRTDGFSAAAEIFCRARYRLEQVGPQDRARSVEPRPGDRGRREPWRVEAAVAGARRDAGL